MTKPISQVDALTMELADAQATIARLERELAETRDRHAITEMDACLWADEAGRLQRALDAAGIVRGGDSLSAREILAAAEKLARVPVPDDSLPQAVVMRD